MTVSELDEEVYDLEWFAVDGEGAIGHFTTGGMGTLPRSVAVSNHDLHLVSNFFRSQLSPSKDAESILDPKAQAVAYGMEGEAAVARRFSDFLEMASRGLYSFDHAHALGYGGFRRRPCPLYYRVAIPTIPLRVTDLPVEIQGILLRTVLQAAVFSQDEEVFVG